MSELPMETILRSAEDRTHAVPVLGTMLSELSGVGDDPEEVLRVMLLSIMGTFGTRYGFIAAYDPRDGVVHMERRGLDEAMESSLQNLPALKPENLFTPFPFQRPVRSERVDEEEAKALFPHDAVLIRFEHQGGCRGLLGIGGPIQKEQLTSADAEALRQSVEAASLLLENASIRKHMKLVAGLLDDEERRRQEASERFDRAKRDLDRKLFDLSTLYESTRELAGTVDPDRICESFLLTVMGVVGTAQGLVFVTGDEVSPPKLTLRGVDESDFPDAGAIKPAARLSKLFASEIKNPSPMSVETLTDEKTVKSAGLPFPVSVIFLFAVDENCQGMVALGKSIGEDSHLDGDAGGKDKELLLTHVNNFLLFLNNAGNFEVSRRLNADLKRRNKELADMIEEITQCRLEADGLRKTKDAVLSVVRRESMRIRRVTLLDFVMLLGFSLLIGLVFNASNPNGISPIPQRKELAASVYIDTDWAKLKYDAGSALFVDARPAEFYKRSHIKGAENMPAGLFDFVFAMKFADLPEETNIVIYGRNISRHWDEIIAEKFMERGLSKVSILRDGLSDWERRGHPTEP